MTPVRTLLEAKRDAGKHNSIYVGNISHGHISLYAIAQPSGICYGNFTAQRVLYGEMMLTIHLCSLLASLYSLRQGAAFRHSPSKIIASTIFTFYAYHAYSKAMEAKTWRAKDGLRVCIFICLRNQSLGRVKPGRCETIRTSFCTLSAHYLIAPLMSPLPLLLLCRLWFHCQRSGTLSMNVKIVATQFNQLALAVLSQKVFWDSTEGNAPRIFRGANREFFGKMP